MNILVTGSNGYIGGHVCQWLKDKGNHVIGLGRHKDPIKEVDEYVCCDLYSEKVKDIFNYIKVDTLDAVVHLAADMRKEPYTTEVIASNCVGTQRLLEFCETNKVAVFVQLSSLPVIGKPIQNPITEDHPLNPPTVYHVTKRTQELLAGYATNKYGLRTVSLRISSPVGVGINPKTILPVFIKRAMSGEDLLLYGKGTRQQNYIHVRDIAQAIEKAIISNAQGVYNLGSNNLISNYDLAKKCIEVIQSESQIVFAPVEDPMDNDVWNVSLEKLCKDTGYKPEIPIETAILEIWNDYKKEKEGK